MVRALLTAFAVSPVLLFAAAGPAMADSQPTGADFGCHVSMHAQSIGFGQGMNPGQHHRGFSGWDGMPC